jgi:hypothetical protein
MGTDEKHPASERRREARAKAITLVSLGQVDDRGEASALTVGRTLDLSRDGVRLEVSHSVPVGGRIRLSLALGETVVEIDGTVRSTTEIDDDQFALGIEFDHDAAADPSIRESLEQYLSSHK